MINENYGAIKNDKQRLISLSVLALNVSKYGWNNLRCDDLHLKMSFEMMLFDCWNEANYGGNDSYAIV